jgi:hypothetical protein
MFSPMLMVKLFGPYFFNGSILGASTRLTIHLTYLCRTFHICGGHFWIFSRQTRFDPACIRIHR